MELRQIECFIAVAEELSFRKAAERMYMTQPPLSRQIKQLESELKTDLFDRSGKRVALTYSGEIFYQKAKHVVESVEDAKDALRYDQKQATGLLRIDLTFFGISKKMPHFLKAFERVYPNVRLVINDSSGSYKLKEKLLNKETDIIVTYGMKSDSRLISTQIETDKTQYVVSDQNPLANRKEIDLKLLEHERFIFFPRQLDPLLYDAFLTKCYRMGFSPKITQHVESMWKRTNLVSLNMGVTIAARNFSQYGIDRIHYIDPVSDQTMELPVTISTLKRNDNPFVERFLELSLVS